MPILESIESSLEGVFKGAPQLPEKTKKSLADLWPWLALVFGILQLLAAYWLWELTRRADPFFDYYSDFIERTTGNTLGLSGIDRTFIYIGVAILFIDGVLLLLAYPKLKKRLKSGWNLLFLAALINVAYAVVSLFIDARGFGSFLFGLIGSAVGFWLLFQIKSQYKKD